MKLIHRTVKPTNVAIYDEMVGLLRETSKEN